MRGYLTGCDVLEVACDDEAQRVGPGGVATPLRTQRMAANLPLRSRPAQKCSRITQARQNKPVASVPLSRTGRPVEPEVSI